MPGSFSQAAFFYQNHIAAHKLLDSLEFGSPIKSLTFDNYNKGPHIDDIIVENSSSTQYYQIKWSSDDNSPFTIYNLITPQKDETRSLLLDLVEGYQRVKSREPFEIILFSTKNASNQKRPGQGIDKGLAEFLREIHQPLVENPLLKPSDLPNYAGYDNVIGKIRTATGLEPDDFYRFLRSLRFALAQPGKEEQKQMLELRLDALGIGHQSYEKLLVAAVEWSISGDLVQASNVIRRLGLANRFLDRIAQDFPVEERYYVENDALFAGLDRAIETLEGGFILLEGPPGSGKSTYLTEYRKERPAVRFAYYCFVPDEVALGNPRLEKETFLKSLCVGIRNSFPHVNFPEPYSDNYPELLPMWLQKLSELGNKIVFIIDGLDHVDKKKEKLAAPLTHYLEGTLPPNVFLLLSSQYREALATGIQTQILADERRLIPVGKLSEGQTEVFLRRRGLHPSPKIAALARTKSEGLPIYLVYIATLLLNIGDNEYLQEHLLNNLPQLQNDQIDTYHETLYAQISQDALAVGAFALLAVRREFTDTVTLVDLLSRVGVQSSTLKIGAMLETYKHLLRVSDARGYTILHNSFREFVLGKAADLVVPINDALVGYYKDNPNLDETYRNFYRHLLELKKYEAILTDCGDEWLLRSWQNFRPFEEISENLNLAWDAATRLLKLKEFVRIAFLQQRFGRVIASFEYAEHFDPNKFLLDINRPEEALRRIWDGDTLRCSASEFYDFVKGYYEKTGTLLPERITSVGFQQFRRRAGVGETMARFQARVLYEDWRRLFADIENFEWRSTDDHTHDVVVASAEENHKTNNSIKNKVSDVLFQKGDLAALVDIANTQGFHPTVVNHARLRATEILLDAGEAEDAIKYIASVDFTLIDRASFNRLIVKLAESKILEKVASQIPNRFDPPALFHGLITEGPRYSLKDDLLTLYDDLRVSFVLGSAEPNVYAIRADSHNPPERNFFRAIIELAKVWRDWTIGAITEEQSYETLKNILDELNLDHKTRTEYFEGSAVFFDDGFIRDEIHKIYAHIFTFASSKLRPPFVSEIVRYWLGLDKGPDGYKNQQVTIDFGKSLYRYYGDESRPDVAGLLQWAETHARAHDETGQLVPKLIYSVEAYGYCGLDSDVQRLWGELFIAACGVHDRKDYQFSEVIGALENAHKEHPEQSRGRLIKLLKMAHQLLGAADDRAVARAIGGLINFSCELSPALAITLLETEEESVYRDELIGALAHTLAGKSEIDFEYVWSIIRTMDKWSNFRSYNDTTYPAMLDAFKSSLDRKEFGLAEKIYQYARHQLLVEKEMPGRVGQFAQIALTKGARFSTIEADASSYAADWQAEQKDVSQQNKTPGPENMPAKPTFEELHTLSESDFDKFELELRDQARNYSRRLRRKDAIHALITLAETLSKVAGLRAPGYLAPQHPISNTRHFVEFRRRIFAADGETEIEFVEQLRGAFKTLLEQVCAPMFGEGWKQHVTSHFDTNEWLRKFASSMYHRTKPLETEMIGDNLSPLIQQASISSLGSWEQLCRRTLTGYALTKPLLEIAARIRNISKQHALELLIEAWATNRDFFYTYGSEATNSFLEMLFELDPERAKHTVLEGFSHQYKRFPRDIVYHLDQITTYANSFGESDVFEFIYSEYEKYNQLLIQGLTTKETNLDWIERFPVDSPFEPAVIRYLLQMFDYPPVENRKLALASLFDLISSKRDTFNVALGFWPALTANAREHLLSLAYSLAVENHNYVMPHKEFLFSAFQTQHFNVRQLAKETLLFCLSKGVQMDQGELQRIGMINVMPKILRQSVQPGVLKDGKRFIPSSYQSQLLRELYLKHRGDDLTKQLYTNLTNHGWTTQTAMDQESATRRRHNINSNFDNIEIDGPYFAAVQQALNETFLKEIDSQNYDDTDIQSLKHDFRLYDPADVLTESRAPGARDYWSGAEVNDEDFLAFSDIESRFSDYARYDHEFLKLFEDGHQRTGTEERTTRTTYFTVYGFLARESLLNKLNELLNSNAIPIPYLLLHNLFRHEIPEVFPSSQSFPIAEVRPILGVSKNLFRGQNELSIATLLPDLINELSLSREHGHALNFLKNGKEAVLWTNWQTAYDQDRRRRKPRAAGVSLAIRSETLKRYLNRSDYRLCFDIKLKRTVDSYKPESQMNWRSFRRVLWH